MTKIDGKSSKVALITGAARGIGKACALDLAKSEYDVAIVDMLEAELQETAESIRQLDRKVLPLVGDVADFSRTGKIIEQTLTHLGRIDFLLNNAGCSAPIGILEASEDDFDRALAVNLKSCFNYIKHCAPHMLTQGGGRIVNMSSLNALSGGVTAAVSKFAYAAAKAGILGLTRALAKELGPSITVNAICPGVIQTEIETNITQRGQEIIKGIALGRLGKSDDVAQLVTFLATSDPCFMTGQTFIVDGFQFNV